MEKYLTLEEAAKELGITYGTLRNYVFYKRVPTIKKGRRRYVPATYVAQAKEQRKHFPSP